MGNCYDTLLECKSNSQLLKKIDPREIIKKTKNKFVSCKNGVYYFQSEGGSLLADILDLSAKYPDEVFIARIWNVDYYASELNFCKFKAGSAYDIRKEPNYGYHSSHLEEIMGKENFNKLMQIALKYIKRLSAIQDKEDIKNEIAQEMKDKINSYASITVENNIHKIEATRMTYSYIKVVGYVKEDIKPMTVWKEIKEEKNNNHKTNQTDCDDEFETISDEYPELPL